MPLIIGKDSRIWYFCDYCGQVHIEVRNTTGGSRLICKCGRRYIIPITLPSERSNKPIDPPIQTC